MKKILVLLLLLVTFTITSCGNEGNRENQLVVGMECGYAPFNWTESKANDKNHKISGASGYVNGYDVWIAKRIAEDLGKELVIKKVDWDGLIPALTSGMIDAVIAGMSPRADRKETINFTNSYYDVENVIIVSKTGNFKDVTDVSGLKGAKIMGQESTVYDELAQKLATMSEGVYQNPLDTIPLVINALNTGVIDVTIVEKPVASSILANNSNLMILDIEVDFELTEDQEILSIGIAKTNNDLLASINASLAKITKDERNQLMEDAISASEGQ